MAINFGNFLSKAAGGAGLATIAYDAHKIGQMRAAEGKKNAYAENGRDVYINTSTQDSPSAIMSAVQKAVRKTSMTGGIITETKAKFGAISGYVKGFCESLTGNVVPLALSAASILTKGKISKASSIGLAAYAGISVAKGAFGVGKNNPLKN